MRTFFMSNVRTDFSTMNQSILNVFENVAAPCRALAKTDPVLKMALGFIEKPHIRKRQSGFPGLVRIIVEQQVSVPSAQAIWARVKDGVNPMTAKTVLVMGEERLRTLGLTRQKARYITCVAEAVQSRSLQFGRIKTLPDEEASAALQSIKGVGPWSSGIYLLFCEGRIDIWPPGDVALEHAYAHAAGWEKKPSKQVLNDIAEKWKPWRGLAAHILWTYYAHIRNRKPI